MSDNEKKCQIQSDCGVSSSRDHADELFKDNWEVFVIRHDKATGKFSWFTECCKRIVNGLVNGKKVTSV